MRVTELGKTILKVCVRVFWESVIAVSVLRGPTVPSQGTPILGPSLPPGNWIKLSPTDARQHAESLL